MTTISTELKLSRFFGKPYYCLSCESTFSDKPNHSMSCKSLCFGCREVGVNYPCEPQESNYFIIN